MLGYAQSWVHRAMDPLPGISTKLASPEEPHPEPRQRQPTHRPPQASGGVGLACWLPLDDHEVVAPAGPEPGRLDPEDPVTLPQPRALHRHSESRQLRAECPVVDGQSNPGQEQSPDEANDPPDHLQRVAFVRIAPRRIVVGQPGEGETRGCL
jgi:hypothetical protein